MMTLLILLLSVHQLNHSIRISLRYKHPGRYPQLSHPNLTSFLTSNLTGLNGVLNKNAGSGEDPKLSFQPADISDGLIEVCTYVLMHDIFTALFSHSSHHSFVCTYLHLIYRLNSHSYEIVPHFMLSSRSFNPILSPSFLSHLLSCDIRSILFVSFP